MNGKIASKSVNDHCQLVLKNLLSEKHNKYCADCGTEAPLWASWSLGIFICIKCAGIHRNLGVHISKVKSIILDTWDYDHLFMLQNVGNKKAKEIYEANLPSNFNRSKVVIDLDYWIRSKYEYKKFILKNWVPPIQEKKKHKKKRSKRTDSEKKRDEDSSIQLENVVKDTNGSNSIDSSTKASDEIICNGIEHLLNDTKEDMNQLSRHQVNSSNNGSDLPILNETDKTDDSQTFKFCFNSNSNNFSGFDGSKNQSTYKKGHTLCSSLWE